MLHLSDDTKVKLKILSQEPQYNHEPVQHQFIQVSGYLHSTQRNHREHNGKNSSRIQILFFTIYDIVCSDQPIN